MNKIKPTYLPELYTNCLRYGIFPNIWKRGKVIFLLPKGDKDPTSTDAYRPVMLLPTLGKCLERIMANHLPEYANDNDLIPPLQFGFHARMGTEDCTHRVVSSTNISRMINNFTAAVALDMKGAFNNIAHSHIRNELLRLGFS